MKNGFGSTSTTDDVLAGIDLRGKRALVTGVSAGIGVETARALAAHGAHLVGAVRDVVKAEAATTQVRKDAAANGGSFELIALDLGDLKSVRTAADLLVAKGELFDGRFCSDCQVTHSITPEDAVHLFAEDGVRAYAIDRDQAEALWKKSEELVGESF